VNPSPKASASPSPHQATWEFAEKFVPVGDHAATARKLSAALGVTPISTGTAALLTLLGRLVGARSAVEIGTGAGVSGLALLGGLAADGVLTSIDSEPEHQQAARTALDDAGYPTRRARLTASTPPGRSRRAACATYSTVNHALVGGRVADEASEDDDTVIMREVLEAIRSMDEFSGTLLPVGDGVLVAYRH